MGGFCLLSLFIAFYNFYHFNSYIWNLNPCKTVWTGRNCGLYVSMWQVEEERLLFPLDMKGRGGSGKKAQLREHQAGQTEKRQETASSSTASKLQGRWATHLCGRSRETAGGPRVGGWRTAWGGMCQEAQYILCVWGPSFCLKRMS